MASGKTHDRITWALSPAVWMGCHWGLHLSGRICLLIVVGNLIGGLLLSPDLDTRSRPFYRWGLFRFIWWPYQWMAKHRSQISHGIWLASWLRLIYLSAVLTLLYCATYLIISHWMHLPAHAPGLDILAFLKSNVNNILWLGVGLWVGALLHIILDYLSSAWVSRQKRR